VKGVPPLAPASFPIDTSAAVEAFRVFLQALVDTTGNADARKALTALTDGRLSARRLVLAFCHSDAATIEQEAEAAGELDGELLIHLAELAVKPQFVAAARQLDEAGAGAQERRDHCPACGCSPDLALVTDALGAEAVMLAVCRLGESEWPIQRVRCLACGNQDTQTLSYLQADGEEEARIYLCQLCHYYLPVLDVRGRLEFAPAAERAALAHLDILAQTHGCRPLPGGCAISVNSRDCDIL
jgi:FdhE protein